MPTSSPLFIGRAQERQRFRQALALRSGAWFHFHGIGGIGKSTLLRRLYADATGAGGSTPPVTPYVVLLDLEQITTAVQLFEQLLAGLKATGKTTRRHRLFWRVDTLAECRRQVEALAAQTAMYARQFSAATVNADRNSQIGNVSIQQPTTVIAGAAAPMTIGQVLHTIQQTIAHELPVLVTTPPGAQGGYLPRQLLVLLCDSLDKTSQEVRQVLWDLWSEGLQEQCLLVCAGREALPPGQLPQMAKQYELRELDRADMDVWFALRGIDDRPLRDAVAGLCSGVPMMLNLAVERILTAREQGRVLGPADFRLPYDDRGGEVAREAIEAFLVRGYLDQLEQGDTRDRQQARLISHGCLLRRFEPQEVLSAVELVERDSAGPLLRRLAERGLLEDRRMHEVIRRIARARLRLEEPKYFGELIEKVEAYYQGLGTTYEADILHARLLRGDPTGPSDLLASVRRRLDASDVPGVTELIAAALEAEPPDDARWYVELAKVDLAMAEGQPARAERRLLRLLDGIGEDQARVELVMQRLGAFDLKASPRLMIWRAQHGPPDGSIVQVMLHMANALAARNIWQLTADLYAAVHALAEQLGNWQDQVTALQGLGDMAQYQGDLAMASRHYQAALALSQKIENRQDQAHTLRGLGDVALQQSDLAMASRHYQAALALSQKIENWLGQADALRGLGEVALVQSEWATASHHYQAALELYEQIEDRAGQARTLLGLGEVVLAQSEWATASHHYQAALELYEQIEDRQGQANALRVLGEVALAQSDVAMARQHFQAALALSQKIENRQGQADALRGLGGLALTQGDWVTASRHYQAALALSQKIENRQGQAEAFQGLGEVARMQSDLAMASSYHQAALEVYKEIENRLGQAHALRVLGHMALAQSDLPKANLHYQAALELYKEIENRLGQAHALHGLGNVAFRRRHLHEARTYAESALDLSKAIRYLVGQHRSWTLLEQIATAEGNQAEALFCHQEAKYVSGELRKRR